MRVRGCARDAWKTAGRAGQRNGRPARLRGSHGEQARPAGSIRWSPDTGDNIIISWYPLDLSPCASVRALAVATPLLQGVLRCARQATNRSLCSVVRLPTRYDRPIVASCPQVRKGDRFARDPSFFPAFRTWFQSNQPEVQSSHKYSHTPRTDVRTCVRKQR